MITITISDLDNKSNKEKSVNDTNSSREENSESELDSDYTDSDTDANSEKEKEEIHIDEETKVHLEKCEGMINDMSSFQKLIKMGTYYNENKGHLKLILEPEQLHYFKNVIKFNHI